MRSWAVSVKTPGPLELPPDSEGAVEELCNAARAGHVSEVEALIDIEGVAVDSRSADGLTPLMLACVADGHDPINGRDSTEAQRLAIAELLLERGADVNANGPGGWTAMFYAAFYAQESLLRRILEAQADVHHLDEAHRSAASWARFGDLDRDHVKAVLKLFAQRGFPQHVDVLVRQGTVSCPFHAPVVLDRAARAKLTNEAGSPRSPKARSPKAASRPLGFGK
mmetsp:Transcript_80031/g.242952  ORF Transcript_80031/g.242952 Transcript_80031/m.242952 type:complete len:224 (+) Transcript_80031:98-769(+)